MGKSDHSYHAIVVGGGIAGLTSAAYLARAGQKVLLIEKNEVCGGLVNSFKRHGFHFDAGVRALEDAGIIFPMLADLGLQLEVVKSPVSVGVENEILHIKDIQSLRDYQDLLIKLYPESEKEIKALVKIIRRIMRHMDVLYGIENPMFKNLKQDRAFIFKKLLPWFPKFLFTVGKINRMNAPVEDYLNTIISDPSLRDIISQHFFKHTPTFFALSYFSLYLDYFYPKGGVGKLAELLEKKIIEEGGEVLKGTKVIQVIPDTCMVEDQHSVVYTYDHLIWAADLKTFYTHTKTEGLLPKHRTHFDSLKQQVLNCRGGDSVFSLFVEADLPLDYFRDIAHGHFFYTPSRMGLGETHRKELRHLLDHWDSIEKKKVLSWLDTFLRLNTYEISIPGLKDPDLAPPGKTGIIISFLSEYDLFKHVLASGWYDEFKQIIEDRVIKIISSSAYPRLKDHVIARFSFTPLNIERRVCSSEGAITGWSFEKPVPVVNKIHISDRSVLTPIPTIFQAGQWAYSPAGVPMSILTGKLASDKVLKKSKFTKPD